MMKREWLELSRADKTDIVTRQAAYCMENTDVFFENTGVFLKTPVISKRTRMTQLDTTWGQMCVESCFGRTIRVLPRKLVRTQKLILDQKIDPRGGIGPAHPYTETPEYRFFLNIFPY